MYARIPQCGPVAFVVSPRKTRVLFAQGSEMTVLPSYVQEIVLVSVPMPEASLVQFIKALGPPVMHRSTRVFFGLTMIRQTTPDHITQSPCYYTYFYFTWFGAKKA